MTVYNVSVLVGRGTRTIIDHNYTKRREAEKAFHKAAREYITDRDACVSLGVERTTEDANAVRHYGTLAVKYTGSDRVELTCEYYRDWR
jgi:hypothetical protein